MRSGLARAFYADYMDTRRDADKSYGLSLAELSRTSKGVLKEEQIVLQVSGMQPKKAHLKIFS